MKLFKIKVLLLLIGCLTTAWPFSHLSSQAAYEISLETEELASVQFPVALDSSGVEVRGYVGSIYTLLPMTLNPKFEDCQPITLFSFTKGGQSYIGQVQLHANRFLWKEELKKKSVCDLTISSCPSITDTVAITIPAVIEQKYNSLSLTIRRGYRGEIYLQDSQYLAHISIMPYVRWLGQITISIEDGENEVFWDKLSFGESFTFNDKVYTLDTIDLFLQQIGMEEAVHREKVMGVREHQFIPGFDTLATLFSTEKKLPVSGGTETGKNYLFHFWGQWCRPCMIKMPALQTLFGQLDNDIQLVNVALVRGGYNILQTKQTIEEKKMAGIHFLEPVGESRFIELFKITQYPSFMIISNEGKVKYRSDSRHHQVQLEEYLQEKDYLSD